MSSEMKSDEQHEPGCLMCRHYNEVTGCCMGVSYYGHRVVGIDSCNLGCWEPSIHYARIKELEAERHNVRLAVNQVVEHISDEDKSGTLFVNDKGIRDGYCRMLLGSFLTDAELKQEQEQG